MKRLAVKESKLNELATVISELQNSNEMLKSQVSFFHLISCFHIPIYISKFLLICVSVNHLTYSHRSRNGFVLFVF